MVKRKDLKTLEKKIRDLIDQAKIMKEFNPEMGHTYLNTANELYLKLEGNGKNKEEVGLILDSINYAYSNPGEPIQ